MRREDLTEAEKKTVEAGASAAGSAQAEKEETAKAEAKKLD